MTCLVQSLQVVERVVALVERPLALWPAAPMARELAGRVISSTILAGLQGDTHHLAALGAVALSSGFRRALLLRRVTLAQQRGAPHAWAATQKLVTDLKLLSCRLGRLDPHTVAGLLAVDNSTRAAAKLLLAAGAFGVPVSAGKSAEDHQIALLRPHRYQHGPVDDVLLLQSLSCWRSALDAIFADLQTLLRTLRSEDPAGGTVPLTLEPRLLRDVESKLTPDCDPVADEIPIICAIATALATLGHRQRLEALYDEAQTERERRRVAVTFVDAHLRLFRDASPARQDTLAAGLREDLVGIDYRHLACSTSRLLPILHRVPRQASTRTTAAIALRAGTLGAPKVAPGRALAACEAAFAERLRRDCDER